MRIFLTLIILLITANSFSQNRVTFQLESIVKENPETESQDTTNLITPKKVLITANPLSPITELTKFNGYIIAVQFEVLKSRLENTEHLIFGLSFFKKKNGEQKWESFSGHGYSPVWDSNGKLGSKGIQIASTDFRLSKDGPDYLLTYQLQIN
jgi:hypothetical protein